jgi:hypothetical protein
MNNLFLKKALTIFGAGGGNQGGQSAPPPNIAQYPAVLAPPQLSNVSSIASFSYAEIIDLISDGPIEGLINKNGKKVYDENIFEGILLNDTPIKETSSQRRQSIPISFIKEKLKNHWKYKTKSDGSFATVSNKLQEDYLLSEQENKTSIIQKSEIDDANFTDGITITSYHPDNSVYEFIDSLNASFDAVSLIQKAFDLSPIINERPFLTKIYIPKFKINLRKDLFDSTEGGTSSISPLKIGITDLSNYIYFSIGSETLNSFNYFELPRSFVNNNSFTIAGKKTFKKNLVSDVNYLTYEVYDLSIYIWSIYNYEIGIKQIDDILDLYLKNIYIFQNDISLFNYNLVQSEFKNGSEIQAPLKYFTNVEIDTDYSKELIGAYCICNCFNPTENKDPGGIQRITYFGVSNSYTTPTTTININDETSDDIRYIKSWPVEYDCKGAPYLICNAKLNYTQFDKTSVSRTSQEAVPITHYIANDNVEEVFVSINIQSLYDTNHVDLVANNCSYSIQQSKLCQTNTVDNTNTYGSVIGYTNTLGSTQGYLYLLIYGKSSTYGYVLDGFKTTQTSLEQACLSCNLCRLIDPDIPDSLYYRKLMSPDNGLISKINDVTCFVYKDKSNSSCIKYYYKANDINGLVNYEIPNDSYSLTESFQINKTFPNDLLETKLKLLTNESLPFYCFGLDQNESIIKSSCLVDVKITDKFLDNLIKDDGYCFFISKISYITASNQELSQKATVASILNSYIDWRSIFNLVPDAKDSSTYLYQPNINKINYPNIFKYIIEPLINYNINQPVSTFWNGNVPKNAFIVLGNLYLIGINTAYLISQTNFFTSTDLQYLKLNILDQLMEEFLLKTDQSATFYNIDNIKPETIIQDLSTTKALESALLKFENGKLIGSSSIFSLQKYKISDYTPSTDLTLIDKNLTILNNAKFNINNIFIYRSQYFDINIDKDIIFYYKLYSNVSQSTSLTPSNNATYVDMVMQNDGTQKANTTAPNLINSKQSLTAGTKLPAMVVVDIETGYESKEKEIYRGNCEYFSYRYNIFGIATDNAIIDLGRKSYNFVTSCKLSFDRGGYVQDNRSVYYENLPLFLVKVICCSTCANTYITNFHLTDKKNIFIGDMDLFKIQDCLDLGISYIIANNINIGVQQDITKSSLGNNGATINDNYDIIKNLLTKNNANPALSNDQLNLFFDENNTIMNLPTSIDYLKSTNLIACNLSAIETYINSFGVCCNTNIYDKYILQDDNNFKCLELNIYNYTYTGFETIYVNPNWKSYTDNSGTYYDVNKKVEAKTLYFAIYTDVIQRSNNNIISLYQMINRIAPDDVIIPFDGFVLRISGKNLFKKEEIVNSLELTTFNNLFITSFFNFTLNPISLNSKFIENKYKLSNDIIDIIINNYELISSELYKNNLISGNEILTPIGLKNSLDNLYYYAETVGGANSYKYDIYTTKQSSIITEDKRVYLQSLSLRDPLTINAKFWIFNKKNSGYSHLYFYQPSGPLYKEIEDIPDFYFTDVYTDLSIFTLGNDIETENKGGGDWRNKELKVNVEWSYSLNGNINVHFEKRTYPDYAVICETWFGLVNEVPLYATRLVSFDGSKGNLYRLSWGLDFNSKYNLTNGYSKKIDIPNYYLLKELRRRETRYQDWNSMDTKRTFASSIITSKKNLTRNGIVTIIPIKHESGETSISLQKIEKVFLDNGIFPIDMRFFSYDQSPTRSFNNDLINLNTYEVNISNVSYNTKNTFATDIGTRIQIPLPKNDYYGNPMRRYVKITKKSHETLSPLISKRIALNKVTEIIPQKFSYPFSSIVGTKIDARAFSQIPTRTFNCKLKKILVPSNYFPNNEDEEDIRYLEGNGTYTIYKGHWDGTFKLSWSNNPAWILMDLLINKRYGLGGYIESDQVDIWELYKIARWCDCVDDIGKYYGVDDGYGGIEPRHSFNAIITEKFNVFDMINQVASIFRGHVYYMNSLITFDDDRIKPIIGEFNNNDVKDGLFNYTNHKKDDEYTAVDIAYIDSRDSYKPKIEYVEDSDGIRQRGILKKNINAFGITSRGQARRFGKYFLYQTSKENSNVSFTTDTRALLYKPGDLIRVNDELINSIKNFGTVKKIEYVDKSSFKVTIDKILDTGIYDDTQISLYVPIAKAKYDDFYASSQFVPKCLTFETSSPILGTLNQVKSGNITINNINYNGLYSGKYTQKSYTFNMKPFDTTSPIKSFSGVVDATCQICTGNNIPFGSLNLKVTGYLCYVDGNNMNNQPSKYGYWQFSTGVGDGIDTLNFDVLQNESLKYQLPYKNYFFEYFDTGRYTRITGYDEVRNLYLTDSYEFDPDPKKTVTWSKIKDMGIYKNEIINPSISKFTICGYENPKIAYKCVIMNDTPSIDTFQITGYNTGNYVVNDEVLNEYSELYLSRSGYNAETNTHIPKSSVNFNEDNLVVGTSYSLNLLNKRDKIYKIMSVSENYINEYNILATEYNLDKFKEIEENYEIDNLQNTFNFLNGNSESQQTTISNLLAAPVISSLIFIAGDTPFIEIRWSSVQNADKFKIFMQTPSKVTNNHEFLADSTDYQSNLSSYVKALSISQTEDYEVGTYIISIQSFNDGVDSRTSQFSALSKRSINILSY